VLPKCYIWCPDKIWTVKIWTFKIWNACPNVYKRQNLENVLGTLIHLTECSCAPSRWRYSESHISQVRNSCTDGGSGDSFRPNFVLPLNFPLHFLSLLYLPLPSLSTLLPPYLPFHSLFPLSYSSLFPLTPSPFRRFPHLSFPFSLPTYPLPSSPSLPISPPHSLSPVQFPFSTFPLIPSLTPPIPSFPYPFLHFVVTFFVVSSNFVTIQAGDTRYPTLMHCPSGGDAIRRRFFCFFLPSLSSSPLPFGYKKITL